MSAKFNDLGGAWHEYQVQTTEGKGDEKSNFIRVRSGALEKKPEIDSRVM